jgi:hypothetical protein
VNIENFKSLRNLAPEKLQSILYSLSEPSKELTPSKVINSSVSREEIERMSIDVEAASIRMAYRELHSDLQRMRLDTSFCRLDNNEFSPNMMPLILPAVSEINIWSGKKIVHDKASTVPRLPMPLPSNSGLGLREGGRHSNIQGYASMWAIFSRNAPHYMVRCNGPLLGELERLPIDLLLSRDPHWMQIDGFDGNGGIAELLKKELIVSSTSSVSSRHWVNSLRSKKETKDVRNIERGQVAVGARNYEALAVFLAQLRVNKGFGHAVLDLQRADGSSALYSLHAYPVRVSLPEVTAAIPNAQTPPRLSNRSKEHLSAASSIGVNSFQSGQSKEHHDSNKTASMVGTSMPHSHSSNSNGGSWFFGSLLSGTAGVGSPTPNATIPISTSSANFNTDAAQMEDSKVKSFADLEGVRFMFSFEDAIAAQAASIPKDINTSSSPVPSRRSFGLPFGFAASSGAATPLAEKRSDPYLAKEIPTVSISEDYYIAILFNRLQDSTTAEGLAYVASKNRTSDNMRYRSNVTSGVTKSDILSHNANVTNYVTSESSTVKLIPYKSKIQEDSSGHEQSGLMALAGSYASQFSRATTSVRSVVEDKRPKETIPLHSNPSTTVSNSTPTPAKRAISNISSFSVSSADEKSPSSLNNSNFAIFNKKLVSSSGGLSKIPISSSPQIRAGLKVETDSSGRVRKGITATYDDDIRIGSVNGFSEFSNNSRISLDDSDIKYILYGNKERGDSGGHSLSKSLPKSNKLEV